MRILRFSTRTGERLAVASKHRNYPVGMTCRVRLPVVAMAASEQVRRMEDNLASRRRLRRAGELLLPDAQGFCRGRVLCAMHLITGAMCFVGCSLLVVHVARTVQCARSLVGVGYS